ncbi:glycosyltransferase [Microbacterium protaetiae]|uniref:Glycosyltransferase n=1 Tax=Microbacterium protaetiae TaxID=2509458 RepID=A0A4P6ED14_9MICO|nr:WecB/TagA/CpsF family glycosyltransferase [Microbacterium protaetiae]QAY59984.1 glycosyltransferase [Microbacterium protaetiae]
MTDLAQTQTETSEHWGLGTLGAIPAVDIAGIPVHLVSEEDAIDTIMAATRTEARRPLAVASINLDHIHHFARHGQHTPLAALRGPEWFNLVDGAPIAAQVTRVSGVDYPRLAGSDLIEPILTRAAADHLSIGVVGGSTEVTGLLTDRLSRDWPTIRFAGHWAPDRSALADAAAQQQLAAEIRAARVDILLVCLGKPRQEQWIEQYGLLSGARVLLAFGAVVDFLAGRVSRAPRWVVRMGFEWAWRLLLEPRRLAKRYLVQGPPAYLAVRGRPRRVPS